MKEKILSKHKNMKTFVAFLMASMVMLVVIPVHGEEKTEVTDTLYKYSINMGIEYWHIIDRYDYETDRIGPRLAVLRNINKRFSMGPGFDFLFSRYDDTFSGYNSVCMPVYLDFRYNVILRERMQFYANSKVGAQFQSFHSVRGVFQLGIGGIYKLNDSWDLVLECNTFIENPRAKTDFPLIGLGVKYDL